jgi:hypothetical protein
MRDANFITSFGLGERRARIVGVTLSGEAKRKAPVRAEPHLTLPPSNRWPGSAAYPLGWLGQREEISAEDKWDAQLPSR